MRIAGGFGPRNDLVRRARAPSGELERRALGREFRGHRLPRPSRSGGQDCPPRSLLHAPEHAVSASVRDLSPAFRDPLILRPLIIRRGGGTEKESRGSPRLPRKSWSRSGDRGLLERPMKAGTPLLAPSRDRSGSEGRGQPGPLLIRHGLLVVPTTDRGDTRAVVG